MLRTAGTEVRTPDVTGNGLNAAFGQVVYCAAAEPLATFLRVSVMDGMQERAFSTAVLGRLRGGYRVLQMRCPLGTRIECCYLFVHVSFSIKPNLWATTRQARVRARSYK